MTATFHVGDVFDQLATIPDHSVDLVTTSPPFWRQRAYLPADHPDKAKEIGQEASPAEYLAVLLRLTAEFRRVLSRYGSIAVELGDTMAGSGGAGGDYDPDGDGFRPGQPKFKGPGANNPGTPISKSHCQIPELYRAALAYGDWPVLSGHPHPAGRWIIRNTVRWCRPNPTPGDDGDKFRRATSDIVCATLNPRRWWDGDAVRETAVDPEAKRPRLNAAFDSGHANGLGRTGGPIGDYEASGTRPLYDHWQIAPKGYEGAHYAVWTPEIAKRLILTMCPAQVCRTCGEPRRRIVENEYRPLGDIAKQNAEPKASADYPGQQRNQSSAGMLYGRAEKRSETLGWTDCGHDNYRPGLVLDPFAGSGTTLAVATGCGRDATGIDLDPRNADLARERCGMFLEVVGPNEVPDLAPHNPTGNPRFRKGYKHGNPNYAGDKRDYGT